MIDATHASFFSGVGGLDLGLERAGWRTVSFSEIDPYASAVLAERWPGVPNLGDILGIAAHDQTDESGGGAPDGVGDRAGGRPESDTGRGRSDWRGAALWTGGFPCQDLSVAGKRRGMVEGSRSNLAFAFLDLVERHRPPAVLLENVPGLLSSHRGRDMAALTGRLAELGYGVAYRVLDARHFGVPQRRRRVFILGLRSDPDDATGRVAAERAAQVLAVGSRCPRHPATGGEAGPAAADGAGERIAPTLRRGAHGDPGIGRDNDHDRLIYNATSAFGQWEADDEAGTLSRRDYKSTNHLVSPAPDPRGVRATDGLARRLDDRLMGSLREHVRPGSNTDYTVIQEQAATLNSGGNDGGFRTGEHLVVAPTLLAPGPEGGRRDKIPVTLGPSGMSDPLLPLGLDSHRYRCCGNGVIAPVSEYIGTQLLASMENVA